MTRRDVLLTVGVTLIAAILAFNIGIGIVVLNDHKVTKTNTAALRDQVMKLSRLQKTLEQNIAAQVPNRVTNVKHWCGAINQDRDYARARAQQHHQQDPEHFKPYRLPDLNCPLIEAKTAGSAQH